MDKKIMEAICMAQTAKEELIEEAVKLNKFCMLLRGALIGAAALGIIFAFKSYSLTMFTLFSIGVLGVYFILSYFLDVVLFTKIGERTNYLKYIADTMFESVTQVLDGKK